MLIAVGSATVVWSDCGLDRRAGRPERFGAGLARPCASRLAWRVAPKLSDWICATGKRRSCRPYRGGDIVARKSGSAFNNAASKISRDRGSAIL